MKKRLLRKQINQAEYFSQKKEKLKRIRENNRAIFRISQTLHTLKQEIKEERTLPLKEKKQRVLESSGGFLCFCMGIDLLTATGKTQKELERNQDQVILKHELKLQKLAEEPLNNLYKKRQALRSKLIQLGR